MPVWVQESVKKDLTPVDVPGVHFTHTAFLRMFVVGIAVGFGVGDCPPTSCGPNDSRTTIKRVKSLAQAQPGDLDIATVSLPSLKLQACR